MKNQFLFPNKFKKIGWVMLISGLILGLISISLGWEPEWLNWNVPAIWIGGVLSEASWFSWTENNVWNEILALLILVGGLLAAFSKEKQEDEFITKIRLESLVWATYVNYGVLLITILTVYDFAFFWVLVFNMFTLLLFFVVRFTWKVNQSKK